MYKVGVEAPSVDNILVSTTNTSNLDSVTLAITIDYSMVVSIVVIAFVVAVIMKLIKK